MKLHIDTAPVWEIYRQDVECPICALSARVEASNVSYFLGESVMEPSQRIEVNQKGFCGRHFKLLYDAGNRLGLGLLTHTYLKESLKSLQKVNDSLKGGASGGERGLFKRIAPGKGGLTGAVEALDRIQNSCVLCERLDEGVQRYVYTVLYMYAHEPEFPKLFGQSKGMCLRHYARTLDMVPKYLSGNVMDQFVRTLAELEQKAFERLEGEIDWFTKKFDYRNEDKPWGNSRDAVKRSINKLRWQVIDEK